MNNLDEKVTEFEVDRARLWGILNMCIESTRYKAIENGWRQRWLNDLYNDLRMACTIVERLGQEVKQ